MKLCLHFWSLSFQRQKLILEIFIYIYENVTIVGKWLTDHGKGIVDSVIISYHPNILNISVYLYQLHLLRRTHMWTLRLYTCITYATSLQSRTLSGWLDLGWGQSSSPGVLNHESKGEDGEEYPELHHDRKERQSMSDLVAGASWVYIRSVRWDYSETGIPSLEFSNFEINVHWYYIKQ